jgi:phage shock protein A
MKKNLTVEDVKARVKEIKESAKMDYNGAHAMEDSLYEDVLKAISKGKCDDPATLAKEALKTTKIKFARMCS